MFIFKVFDINCSYLGKIQIIRSDAQKIAQLSRTLKNKNNILIFKFR